MDVQLSRYRELGSELRDLIDQAAWAEFEQYAIVRETQWAEPEWSFLGFEDGALVAYFNLVERVVRIDDRPVRVAGLNNMVTLRAHRGKGHASRLLRQAQPRWSSELGAEAGLLLCADALVPFYSRLGWRRLLVPVVYRQPGEERVWSANCMLLEFGNEFVANRRVDLCGLPW
jgi:GNAT superfamily N-acetyltransferase